MCCYVTICDAIAEFVVQKSRFIAVVKRVDTDEQAQEQLNILRKTYYDSTHICYGYIADQAGSIARFSDDGEPSGTAGLPILEVIKGQKLRHTLIAVVRYFGGTKLGTGGLVSAYSQSAKLGLEAAKHITLWQCKLVNVSLDYTTFYKIEGALRALAKAVQSCEFSDIVNISLAISTAETSQAIDKIADLSNGKATILLAQDCIIEL